jgi:hypothetical protein
MVTQGMDISEGEVAEGRTAGEACADWVTTQCFVWAVLLGQGGPQCVVHWLQQPLSSNDSVGQVEADIEHLALGPKQCEGYWRHAVVGRRLSSWLRRESCQWTPTTGARDDAWGIWGNRAPLMWDRERERESRGRRVGPPKSGKQLLGWQIVFTGPAR